MEPETTTMLVFGISGGSGEGLAEHASLGHQVRCGPTACSEGRSWDRLLDRGATAGLAPSRGSHRPGVSVAGRFCSACAGDRVAASPGGEEGCKRTARPGCGHY
jgi:hypothetical protein